MGIGAERPKTRADRPRSWGGSSAFGADVGRIDSGADRPVGYPINLLT